MQHKSLVLLTLMLGTSMAMIDSSIVSVSLPVIQKRFNTNLHDVEWVTTAYMVSFSLFIPLTNWLKNRIGYFNLFIGSVLIFTIGSLLCSVAQSLPILIAARVLQASGGGAISPTSLAILSDSFPKEERGTAIGWWGIGNVMGPAIGPTLGGVLTHYFGWESIFFVNIPIGIATILLSLKYLTYLKAQPKIKERFDINGYIWFGLFIISIQYAINLLSNPKDINWVLVIGLAVSVITFFVFLKSAKKANPLIDLTVFKSNVFASAAIITIIRSLALYGGLFFLPFLLQGLLGYSEIQSGLLMLPNALIMFFTRPYSGRLADRGIIRSISIIGIIITAISMAMFAVVDVGTSIYFIIFAMLVRGVGLSFVVSPVSTALVNSVNPNQTATATSLNSLLQQIGGSVGIAVGGILQSYISKYFISHGKSKLLAQHYALNGGFLISAFVIALAVIPCLKLPEVKKFKPTI
ncbi:MDR family MFS transporter [Rhizosphaericola mali]|uniref:Multidrug efflux MFS transporter n=1 Tax=Rhizosphaericola mali TaxID=2545455 RepID=A0A5P2G5N8_9BACT|nr:MDR family MFS transporter [Rhizosphaericola mali]QES88433.1 multidrug efflux MFS transporter [Rhizosphaericola mali]